MRLVTALALLLAAASATAQSSVQSSAQASAPTAARPQITAQITAPRGPHRLATADEAAGWEAVGRLDIDGKGFCTGALIAPDLVLTAAHCLFDRDTGLAVDPSRVEFMAGLRNGRALAYRDVRRAMPHPAYVFDPAAGAADSGHDLALLELSQAIRSTQVVPFAIGAGIGTGARVSVVSYAFDRAEVPALEDLCDVLGEEAGVLVMTCEVDFGSSGAPIFQVEDGVARIVSVVSAKGELGGERVALGTSLTTPLAELRIAFGQASGTATLPQVRSIAPGERAVTGARFVTVETVGESP